MRIRQVFTKIILGTVVFTLVFGLTGCSSKKQTATTTSKKTTTLYWWRSKEDANLETLQEIAKNYEQQNPGIKIQVVVKDPRNYEQNAIDALAAGQTVADAPDILSLKSEDLPKNLTKLTTAPTKLIDVLQNKDNPKKQTGKTTLEYAKGLFNDAAFKAITFNNPATLKPDIYGLPMALDTLVLYRNKKLVRTASANLETVAANDKSITKAEIKRRQDLVNNTPATWKALTEAIPYIRITNGNDISQAAIALGTATNIERSYDILQSVMMQNGTQLTSDELDSATFNQTLSSAAGQTSYGTKALDFYTQFANPQSPFYTWNDNIVSGGQTDVDAFLGGKVAMILHYGSLYRYLINAKPEMKNDIEIAILPQITNPQNPTGSDNLKVPARIWVETVPNRGVDETSVAKQKAAWSFAYFLSSKNGSRTYTDAMQIPSALKSVKNTRFVALKDQKTIADVWFKGNEPTTIDKLFISMITGVHSGAKSSQTALDETATQVTSILQKSKYKWATASARQAIIAGGEDETTESATPAP